MKLIIAGGRNIPDHITYQHIQKHLDSYTGEWADLTIISGSAKGVDSAGEQFALRHLFKLEMFPADWNKYGKAAGYIRNLQMGKEADELLLIWDGKSKGSKLMKDIMIDLKKPIYEVIVTCTNIV